MCSRACARVRACVAANPSRESSPFIDSAVCHPATRLRERPLEPEVTAVLAVLDVLDVLVLLDVLAVPDVLAVLDVLVLGDCSRPLVRETLFPPLPLLLILFSYPSPCFRYFFVVVTVAVHVLDILHHLFIFFLLPFLLYSPFLLSSSSILTLLLFFPYFFVLPFLCLSSAAFLFVT